MDVEGLVVKEYWCSIHTERFQDVIDSISKSVHFE